MSIVDIEQYHQLAEILECIDEQLAEKKVHDVVIGDSGYPAYSKVTKQIEGYIHGIGSISLLEERKKTLAKMKAISDYISAIPVTTIRNALKLYYIEDQHYTWQEVADELGYEGDLRRYCLRYLAKL